MDIAILDYGTGNLHSLSKALERGGARVRVEGNPIAACSSDALVLPGVGAFADAAERLNPYRDELRSFIASGLPCLGICLGMQLLLDRSEEGPGLGIGAARGEVLRLGTACIPQIGWNSVHAVAGEPFPLLDGVDGEHFYFANSYIAKPHDQEMVGAWSEYKGQRFPAVLRTANTFGVQFHPEKSGTAGLRLIANFIRSVRA